MKLKISLFLCLSLITLFLLMSCKSDREDMIICTMEFRSVAIKVNGNSLDTCYTVRLSTGDTIRPNADMYLFSDQIYPVLTDLYQPQLVNSVDSFRFCGFIQQNKVVDEVFVIKADECHIDYVSGRTEVTL